MEKKPDEQKGLFKRIKEGIDDHEEQMVVLGAMVRLGVVIWSGFIITLNYVELPMVKKESRWGYHIPSFNIYWSTRHIRLVHWQW